MKKYRLLKDLPQLDAGTIFEFAKCDKTSRLYDYYYAGGIFIDAPVVEHNPNWFEEIEQEKRFTKEDLFSFAKHYNKNQNRTVSMSDDMILLGWTIKQMYKK